MDSSVIGFVALVLLIAMLLSARTLRLRSLRRTALSAEDVDDARVALLEFVKNGSYDRGVAVPITAFNKSYGLLEGDQVRVLYPLFESAVLLVEAPVVDGLLASLIDRVTNAVMLPIPDRVILAPKEYDRMVRGESSETIIGELHMGDTNIDITQTGSGMISGVVGAVRGDFDNSRARNNASGLSDETVSRLVLALRSDASNLKDTTGQEEFKRTADELEAAAGEEQRRSVIDRVNSWIALGLRGLDATKSVMDLINGGS